MAAGRLATPPRNHLADGSPNGEFNAGQPEQIVEIAGPTDGDRHAGDPILEDQIPSRQPGEHFSERRVGKCVGAPGYGNHGRHFGIAQGGQRTGQSG